MKIYRLCKLCNYFNSKIAMGGMSEEYFVEEKGLETAKKYFILAIENEDIDVVKLDLCEIDSRGKIMPVENLGVFRREQ